LDHFSSIIALRAKVIIALNLTWKDSSSTLIVFPECKETSIKSPDKLFRVHPPGKNQVSRVRDHAIRGA